MALIRVAYRNMKAIIPSYQDLEYAKMNLAGVNTYLAQLDFLRVSGEVYDRTLVEKVEAIKYIADIEAALLNNGGSRI